jgi:hypothetical protein
MGMKSCINVTSNTKIPHEYIPEPSRINTYLFVVDVLQIKFGIDVIGKLLVPDLETVNV